MDRPGFVIRPWVPFNVGVHLDSCADGIESLGGIAHTEWYGTGRDSSEVECVPWSNLISPATVMDCIGIKWTEELLHIIAALGEGDWLWSVI